MHTSRLTTRHQGSEDKTQHDFRHIAREKTAATGTDQHQPYDLLPSCARVSFVTRTTMRRVLWEYLASSGNYSHSMVPGGLLVTS